MPLRIPLGVSDFQSLREQGLVYVDKSHIIREILDKGAQTFLLPRPRRFGKTLNLTMLRCFFEKHSADRSALFADLSIWQAGDTYRAHFQQYPVIFLSFKDVKAPTWDIAWGEICAKIRALFEAHQDLLTSPRLTEFDLADLRAILDGTASRPAYERAILDLCRCLERHHGRKVVVLVDEYDSPIHAGWTSGYGPEVIAFFRAFFNVGLKDNAHIFKGVVTGILRIAKESIFSDLNNLAVYTLLARDFSTCFGFTEPEVEALLQKADLGARLDTIRAWYNGYVFGGTIIHNPWSILSYLDNPDHEALPYWLTTSSNDLIRDTLQRYAVKLQPGFEALLDGQALERRVDESVVLSQLLEDQDTLWSLLVFSGYLKVEKIQALPGEPPTHRLTIPNLEVRQLYTSTFRRWLTQQMEGHGGDVDLLVQAILAGNAEALEEQLQAFTVNLLSYHDTALRPEQVYHAFLIGLLATLEPDYHVRSNRESGHGRPDVLITPRRAAEHGKAAPGVVLELKVAKRGKKTMAQALEEGVTQIRDGGYAAELSAKGIAPVYAFSVAFDGKRVRVVDAGKAKTRRRSTSRGRNKP